MRDRGQLEILIVDDESLARRGLRMMLRDELGLARVREAASGPEAIVAIRDSRPDIVLLDVHLGASTGFSVVEAFAGRAMPLVIFVTAYDQYALKAFEAHAVDYLLKPVDPARLRDAIARAGDSIARTDHAALRTALESAVRTIQELRAGPAAARDDTRIAVRDGARTVFLAPQEIAYAESAGNNVRIHADGTVYSLRATMEAFAERLGEAFVRIRRSVLVRRAAIRSCTPRGRGAYDITLDDGTKLVSSRFFRAGMDSVIAGRPRA